MNLVKNLVKPLTLEELPMSYRRYYSRDPRWITAKYPGQCSCGRAIHKGDRVMYYPIGRHICCEACGRVTESELEDDDLNQIIHCM